MVAWEDEGWPYNPENVRRLGKLAQEQQALIDKLTQDGWTRRSLERYIKSSYEIDSDSQHGVDVSS